MDDEEGVGGSASGSVSGSASGPAVGPGGALKAARQQRGATVQDVADILNLTTRVVEDLEAEAWENLPGPAFTRGYLRAYAKLLELDSVALTSAYNEQIGDAEGVPLPSRLGRSESRLTEIVQKQPGAVLSASVAAVIVVVALVIWLVWPDESPQTDDALRQAPPVSTRAPAAPRPPPTIQESASPAPTVVAAPEETPEEPPETVAAPPATQPVSAPEAEPVAAPVESEPGVIVGEDRLVFRFKEDCWVEVRDADGRNVHSDLERSGDVLELRGTAPFRITLGYAPGVELSFNGEPVALAPHTRNNVASLVLGQ